MTSFLNGSWRAKLCSEAGVVGIVVVGGSLAHGTGIKTMQMSVADRLMRVQTIMDGACSSAFYGSHLEAIWKAIKTIKAINKKSYSH